MLWQNADGDGFAKAKGDWDGFFGTRILEILEILIGDESLKFGTRMTRVCFGKTRMVTDSLKRWWMVADFLEHGF
ncbi:hypothetical protein [Flavobacterium cucumis]|uniref:hypothetical protein n=1 Tax=Flavobacterium cucumis TaxID=416016 RepID=UPI00093599D6|nr:hypothetical protein [Flavobacterium cucumis]